MAREIHDGEPLLFNRRSFVGRSAVALGGALTLPQFLAAAARGAGTAGGVVRVAIPGDPIMNPLIGNAASAVPFNRAVFSYLTRPANDLQPTPDLATSWKSTRD